MPVIKVKLKEGFTTVPNAFLQDPDLSYELKGFLCELFSRPGDWQIRRKTMLRSHCGETKLRRIVKEAKEKGYLVTTTSKDENGKLMGTEWTVSPDPETLISPRCAKQSSWETIIHTKKENIQRKNYTKKYLSTEQSSGEACASQDCSESVAVNGYLFPDCEPSAAREQAKGRDPDKPYSRFIGFGQVYPTYNTTTGLKLPANLYWSWLKKYPDLDARLAELQPQLHKVHPRAITSYLKKALEPDKEEEYIEPKPNIEALKMLGWA